MPKILAFDIWGRYAHFKKIFATTSALSYAIPSKTAMYGYAGAVIGLEKFDNYYLTQFESGACKIGMQILHPIVMQRISTNLHPHDKGMIQANQNRKPTTLEYVYQPKYRIYFSHENGDIYGKLKEHLQNHTSIYTPTLGLANLLSDFKFIGEFEPQLMQNDSKTSVEINSVIPRSKFINFDLDPNIYNEIIEYSQFSVEMNTMREVTTRDDVFFDRKGQSIRAFVDSYHTLQINQSKQNVIFF